MGIYSDAKARNKVYPNEEALEVIGTERIEFVDEYAKEIRISCIAKFKQRGVLIVLFILMRHKRVYLLYIMTV